MTNEAVRAGYARACRYPSWKKREADLKRTATLSLRFSRFAARERPMDGTEERRPSAEVVGSRRRRIDVAALWRALRPYATKFFPTPVGTPGGKPLRLTARVKIARARPDRFWPAVPFFCVSVRVSVRVCASLSSQIWSQQPTGLREKRPSDFHLIHFARLPRGASRAQFSTK
jgi:hypothetical protein